MAREYNLDGLVGPTHHYGGLAFGNIASATNEGEASNPQEAAIQGLEKMRKMTRLGLPQAVMPPHFRPELSLARRLGFEGSDAEVIQAAAREDPQLLAACYSASAMWTANAATVSPSADSTDGRVHFTPANLTNKIHRSIEAPTTARILNAIFADPDCFVHHAPLPGTAALGDEGAANHNRFAPSHGDKGVQMFVFGESSADFSKPRPTRFPARQTLEACRALVRLHRVPAAQVVYAHQNPDIIDQGVFHNDVISVSNLSVFFHHEDAFVDTKAVTDELAAKYAALTGDALRLMTVPRDRVPVPTAVSTYLFNSQLVTLPSGALALIAPTECQDDESVKQYIDELVAGDAPLDEVHYMDVRQSMSGGGGPACLRLRVVLTPDEEARMNRSVVFDDALFETLTAWVKRHYRDRLQTKDLVDPKLIDESRTALDELTTLLRLGSVYDFQTSSARLLP